MARLTTYINQNPSDDDLLTGSEFISTGNYKTGNYKLVDLARYFADFYLQNGSVYSLATMSNSITLNANNLSAEATKITELQSQFVYTNDNITGVADALSSSITSTVSTATGAVASDLDKLEAVFTQDSNGDVTGITGVLSTAVTSNANTAIANASLATAQSVTNLTSTVNTNTASISTNQSTIATVEGYAESRYSLKLDANGSFAGMSILASNGNTTDAFSEIRFAADSFKIYNGGQADLTGSYDAPFEVVNNVVKIKSANIGSIAFGDLTGAPTTSFTQIVYASDANGTSPSLTKGTRTFYAIYQGSTSVDLNNLPNTLVFNPITGSTGASGADAKTIKLSSSALVVKYDSEGNNPSPSTITLTANSTNFADGFFKFTGGGSHFTDETSYTDGTGQNQDTASISVPTTFTGFGAPLEMRVGVADGDQVEDAFDTINIAPVKEGSNGLTIVLSNAAHSVPADKDGTVSSFSGSGTDIVVFDGATEYNSVAHDATPGNNEFKVTTSVTTGTITVGAQDITADKVTFADHSGMSTDLAIIEYTINVENTTTIKKYQTINKSKQGLTGAAGGTGSAGINGKSVNLKAADLSFEYTAAGASPSPSSVTVTATAFNLAGTGYYEFFLNDQSEGTSSTTNTYTYTPKAAYADMPETIEVEVRDGGATSAVVARDQISMIGIKPGTDGTDGTSPYVAILTNEAHTLPATGTAANEATYTGSGTTIEVYKGTTQLDSVASSNTPGSGQFTVTAAPSTTNSVNDITAGAITVSGNPAAVADHSGMVQNKATVTYTINCEDSVTLTKVQSLSKSLKGNTGDTGNPGPTGARSISAYIFHSTPSTNAPTFNSSGVTFSFSNNTFSSLPSGWSQDAPEATPGSGSNNYWHIKATVVEGSSSNTITFGNVTRMFGFSGLVTFTGNSNETLTDGTNNFNYTAIDGGAITTGTIAAARIDTGILRVGGNLTGTVDGVAVADIKSGAAAGATANQDNTATILAGTLTGNVTGTIDGTAAGTVKSGAASGATAQQNNSAKTAGTVGGWTIDASAIYSGTKDTSGYTTGGITINSGGSIHTKQFYVDTSGNAFFKGNLSAAGGTFAGDLEVSGTALIKGTDTTNNEFTAVKIINTGSTNGKVGMKLQNSSGYFAQFFLDTTQENNITNYGFDLQLGPASGGGVNTISHFNAGGLCLPKGDVTDSAHSSAGGRSIFFNSDNAAEGPDTGRLHVNGFFKTFFFDIPTPLTTNPNPPNSNWANKGLVFRKWVVDSNVSGGGYRSEIIWVKPATNSLHVKGDIVASESSDERLKDNIKPITNAAEKINKIGGYEFDWNDNQELYEGHDVGVIAQEIEEVLPEVVETREDGYKAVDYKKIVPLLIEGIKDLQRQIDELKNK